MTSSSTFNSRRGPLSFGLRALGFVGLQALIASLLLAAYPPGEDDYLRAHVDKQQTLRAATSPRLLFVGGSNLAFGIDCGQIGSELQRSAINLALHAGLGMDFELAEALAELRAGDAIVISLEHPAFNGFVAGPELWQLLRMEPSVSSLISLRQVRELADLAFVYLAGQMRAWQRRDRKPSPFYLRSSFDQRGDAVAHRNQATLPPLPNIDLAGINAGRIDETIDRLNDFSRAATAKGAQVFYSYPAINRENYQHLQAKLDEIDAAMRARLSFSILDMPVEMAYPAQDFFDTAYHLNARGIARRSAHLIERLRAALQ